MAENARGEATAGKVAQLATHSERLDRIGPLRLIGIAGAEGDRTALFLHQDGAVTRVAPGDQVAGATVQGIDPDRLALIHNGRALILEMPKG